jgi:hypothetical protein
MIKNEKLSEFNALARLLLCFLQVAIVVRYGDQR